MATAAQAQFTFGIGPKVGYNLASVRYRDAAVPNQRAGYRSGLETGVLASLGVGHWAVQLAVLYSQRGFTVQQAGTFPNSRAPYEHEASIRFDYLMLLLNLAYTQRANGQGAQVFGGVYLGSLAGGHYQARITSFNDPYPPYVSLPAGSVRVGDETNVTNNNVYGRRFDSGVQMGLGYRYRGVQAQASYSLGLRNVDTFNSNANYMRNFESYRRGALPQPSLPTITRLLGKP